ncbi:hypothetical protein [Emticicia agri]|uniref:hypothetical protein n=1 Tax=Emticicia agri TaxID=2492393 RepID=UPI001A9226F5|nr:hypothetical protein [Emticicia agri]
MRDRLIQGNILFAPIKKTKIQYKGKTVTAHKLTIASSMEMNIDEAWQRVKTSALLEFLSEGKVTFKPTGGHFPETWKQGSTITTRMLINGFFPFGGLHTLFFEKIDEENKIIQTREHDAFAKVWDHTIELQYINKEILVYQDEIIIYGGILTPILSSWARMFFRHRHRRWQLLVDEKFQSA